MTRGGFACAAVVAAVAFACGKSATHPVDTPDNCPPSQVLASGITASGGFVVDSTGGYLASGSAIQHVGFDGSTDELELGASPNVFAVDAGFVYYATQGSDSLFEIARVPKAGGMATIYNPGGVFPGETMPRYPALGPLDPVDIVIDANSLYVHDHPDESWCGAILSVPLAGGAPAIVAANECGTLGSSDGATLYWSIAGVPSSLPAIESIPVDGGSASILYMPNLSSAFDGGLAFDGNGHIYFFEDQTIESIGVGGGSATSIVTTARGAGVRADASSVYWVELEASADPEDIVTRAAIDDGTQSPLVCGDVFGIAGGLVMAVDAGSLVSPDLSSGSE